MSVLKHELPHSNLAVKRSYAFMPMGEWVVTITSIMDRDVGHLKEFSGQG
jgi:hypothetical protein